MRSFRNAPDPCATPLGIERRNDRPPADYRNPVMPGCACALGDYHGAVASRADRGPRDDERTTGMIGTRPAGGRQGASELRGRDQRQPDGPRRHRVGAWRSRRSRRVGLVPAVVLLGLAFALAPATPFAGPIGDLTTLGAAPAHAGSYEVRACFSAQDQNSWAEVDPWPNTVNAYTACAGGDGRGVAVRAERTGQVEWVAPGIGGAMEFVAPDRARIVRLRGNIRLESYYGWTSGIWDPDASVWAYCGGCTVDWRDIDVGGLGSRRLWLWVQCTGYSPGGTSPHCYTIPESNAGSAGLRNVWVTIADDTLPALGGEGGNLWSHNGWLSGQQWLEWGFSDHEIGVRRVWATAAGQRYGDWWLPCDETLRAPCPRHDIRHGFHATLPSGVHTLRLHVWDAAYNERTVEKTVYIDNESPAPIVPTAEFNVDRWHRDNWFVFHYDPPWSHAPITHTRIKVCPAGSSDPLACWGWTEADPDHRFVVQVPRAGVWAVYAAAQDAAGNVSPGLEPKVGSSAGEAGGVLVRYSPEVPGKAELARRNGWVNAREAAAYPQQIDLAHGQTRPLSDIAGYSVTSDGSDPDVTIEAHGIRPLYTLPGALPEGETTVKARAISGSGVPSNQIDATQVRVDLTAPSVAVAGAPAKDEWQREPVSLVVSGADALSGMTAAPDSQPLTSGGYLTWRLGDGTPVTGRGERANVEVVEDGRHTLLARAVDVAGNESEERPVAFKIDATPPETVVFEKPDPSDPRTIRVAVGDRTSGAASGSVQLRPALGSTTWTELPTMLEEGRLVARVDSDVLLADGLYDVRAVVVDRAGNERIADRREDDVRMQLTLPLRARSTVTVATRLVRRTVCRTISRRRGKRLKRPVKVCTPTKVPRRGRKPITLRPRQTKQTVIYGRLTGPGAGPLAGATVDVTEQPRNRLTVRQIASLQTDAQGSFELPLLRGPSRKLRFHYPGTATVLPAAGELQIVTPARTTFRVAPRRVAHGRVITFSGRLIGGWVPPNGARVELEMRRHGRWQPFGTPIRSDAQGRWQLGWRFHGPLRGRVRARLEREIGYPFEAGRTRSVSVRIAGPKR